ncbi:hypothetical protein EU527_12120 [Candidatus Thorarchaeota archaeon]|nr:MAG: hypothetical protein EU527_12120 [Candidatus Thorarchaeota archaeon]
MNIEVRLATAQERTALDQFYAREGYNFQQLTAQATCTPLGAARETMFIVAVSDDTVLAALKLDIGNDPKIGKVGFVQHFEIEDELENTDLGKRMIDKIIEIAEEKNLSALDTLLNESRREVIDLYSDSGFFQERREIYLRKKFKSRIF